MSQSAAPRTTQPTVFAPFLPSTTSVQGKAGEPWFFSLTTSVQGGSRELCFFFSSTPPAQRAGPGRFGQGGGCFSSQPQTHGAVPGKGEQGARAGQGRRCTDSTSSSLSGEAQRSYRFPGTDLILQAAEFGQIFRISVKMQPLALHSHFSICHAYFRSHVFL